MKETKLQLEAGKYYRTRGGKKVFIIGENPFDKGNQDISFAFGGFVQGDKGDCLEWWQSDGVFNVRPHERDIVAEWVEPKRITGWVNVYDASAIHSGLSSVILGRTMYKVSKYAKESKHEADECAAYFPEFRRIACIEIDVLEGQGLEGGQ